jgi:putative multicomponent Na+:H+ antiporter subunit B
VIEAILLLLLVLLAIIAVETQILRMAVIFLGIFSLLLSFLYLYYGAPDVAIAEAVMASGLVTLLYLTALKRYRVYNICFTNQMFSEVDDRYIIEGTRRGQLLHEIEQFCISKELEPQTVCTPDDLTSLMDQRKYDLIIRQEGDQLTVYGSQENYFVDELEMLLILRYQDLNCKIVRYAEDGQFAKEAS